MATDYKLLCYELFGTFDEREIRAAVAELKSKSNRNAGRKNSLTDSQIKKMREMQLNGMSQKDIAEAFGITRQTALKYLKEKPDNNFGMQIDYMYKTCICTTIMVNFKEERIKIINKTNDILHRAFGVNENPTWDDFEIFLKDRCFPEARGDKKELLKHLEIDSYDPLQIVEKTRGKTHEDRQWLKISYTA